MFRYIVRFFAVIGLLVALLIGGVIYRLTAYEAPPPDRMILSLDLSQPLEEAPAGGLADALDRRLTLTDVLDALERAEKDPNVHGLVARFGGDAWGMAKAHDLREAVTRFRAAGKFAIAHADAFGEGRSGAAAYSVAAAFDEVWLQPLGMISLNWPAVETPFLRDALGSVGVTPQIEKREGFKTAADTFTESGLTPQNREMLTSLAEGWGAELVQAIATARKLTPDAVRALMDQSPLDEKTALAAGLVDRHAYRDDVIDAAVERAGGDAELITALDYLSVRGGPHEDGTGVAVLHAVGPIARGGDEGTLNGLDADSDRLVRGFEEAMDDSSVKAILLRIDSPGGSATASESIRHALVTAKAAGKPVVVSMGDMAGSGGYWIAMDADRIIAAPGTLTGSIGVVMGKLPLKGLFDKLGVTWERVSAGKAGGFWSAIQPWNDEERHRASVMADVVYNAFLQRVAVARRMPLEKTRLLAQGRVWTGAQARDLGLVDGLGGRAEALAALRQVAGLPADAPLALRPFPEPEDALSQALALLTHDGGLNATLAGLTRAVGLADTLTRIIPLAGIPLAGPADAGASAWMPLATPAR